MLTLGEGTGNSSDLSMIICGPWGKVLEIVQI